MVWPLGMSLQAGSRFCAAVWSLGVRLGEGLLTGRLVGNPLGSHAGERPLLPSAAGHLVDMPWSPLQRLSPLGFLLRATGHEQEP